MATKQDIKDTAFTLFARKGYVETTMEDIANVLNLKKQSLYSHFTSKAEIFREIMQDQSFFMINEISSKMGELVTQSTENLLIGIVESYIKVFINRDRLLLWKRAILMAGNDEFGEMRSNIVPFDKALGTEIYNVLKMSNPWLNRPIFNSFFSSYMVLIFGYLEWMLLNNHDDAVFKIVWRNFWHGAKNQLQPG